MINDCVKFSMVCVDCIMGMIRDMISMLDESPASIEDEINAFAQNQFATALGEGLPAPVPGNALIREIKRVTGCRDPYKEFKRRELEHAREIFSQIADQGSNDLPSSVAISVLGNSLDFFTSPDDALLSLPDVIKNGVDFFHDDIGRLEQFLSKEPDLVLFFSDNSGEIFFDIPLFQYIKETAKRTILVVKGGPSLNDLTRKELKTEDLEKKFGEIEDTGTDGVGIDWERSSERFQVLVASADLIISKGMANFETVYPEPLPIPSFFLFKVKCKNFQDYLDAPSSSYWALWKDGIT